VFINDYNVTVSLTVTAGVCVSVNGTDSVCFSPRIDEGNLQ